MSALEYIDKKAFDVLSSGIVNLLFWSLIVVCIVLLTIYVAMITFKYTKNNVEGYASYTSGAEIRNDSAFTQPSQGVENLTPKQEVYYELHQLGSM